MGVVCAEIVFNEFQLLGRHQTYDAPTTPVRDHVRADILDNEARFRAGNEATKYERLAVRSPRGYDPLCDHFIVAWQNIDSSCNFSEVTEHFAPDKWQTYPERLTPRAPVGVRPTSPALVKLQGRVAPQRRPVRSARASSNANVFCSTFHPRLVPAQVLMPRTVSTCVDATARSCRLVGNIGFTVATILDSAPHSRPVGPALWRRGSVPSFCTDSQSRPPRRRVESADCQELN